MNNIVTPKNDLPAQDFLVLGLRELAYVKPIAVGDGEGSRLIFAIIRPTALLLGQPRRRSWPSRPFARTGWSPSTCIKGFCREVRR